MLQYVEAVLADPDDAAVRRVWSALSECGLPSLSDHRGDSNRPHVTLTVVRDWTDPGPPDPFTQAPMRVPLGPVALFGRDPVTLVRTLVLTPDLLSLREALVASLVPPARRFYESGRWVPHVTLATRVPLADVEPSLRVLSETALPEDITLVATRRWDAEARRVHPLR
jgi:hypothetical protein